jgi:hypothetical protein
MTYPVYRQIKAGFDERKRLRENAFALDSWGATSAGAGGALKRAGGALKKGAGAPATGNYYISAQQE